MGIFQHPGPGSHRVQRCFLAEQRLFGSALCAAFLSLCYEFLHQGLPSPTASPPTGLSASALLVPPSVRSLNSSCPLSPHWRMASRSESLDQAACEHSMEMNHVYLKLIRSRATHLSLAASTHLHGLHMKTAAAAAIVMPKSQTPHSPSTLLCPQYRVCPLLFSLLRSDKAQFQRGRFVLAHGSHDAIVRHPLWLGRRAVEAACMHFCRSQGREHGECSCSPFLLFPLFFQPRTAARGNVGFSLSASLWKHHCRHTQS